MRFGKHDPPHWNEATPDDALVLLAQHGQREAFGALYDRYAVRVYGYSFRYLGEREAAQDATGETFRKALSALPSYHATAFRSWLFTIAHNVVIDALRARRSDFLLGELPLVIASVPSPEVAVETAVELDTVIDLLPQLTADQRDAVALRLAGLSPAEIGSVLGKSRAAVDMALHRALVRLRTLVTVDPIPTKGDRDRG